MGYAVHRFASYVSGFLFRSPGIPDGSGQMELTKKVNTCRYRQTLANDVILRRSNARIQLNVEKTKEMAIMSFLFTDNRHDIND